VVAIRAAHAGEPFPQVAALQIFAHNMGDDWTVKAVLTGEEFVVTKLELLEMILQQLPERRVLRISGMIYLCLSVKFHCDILVEKQLPQYSRYSIYFSYFVIYVRFLK
jgi:hypothetical protein